MSDGREKIVWGKPAAAEGADAGAAEADDDIGGSRAPGGYAPRRHGQRTTKHVFITGMDLFSTSEQEKREKRAERFGTDVVLSYKPMEMDEEQRQQEEKKKARAARFGTEYKPKDLSGMGSADLLEQRVEADQASSSRLDTIHVYGVDLLSTKDVMQYFGEYYPQYVEWINDSSCNVVFADSGTAKRVLASLGKPLAESSGGESSSVDQLYKSMGKTWHKGKDFLKGGATPVPIIFRLATDEDVKPKGRGQSRYLWRGGNSGRRRNRKRTADGDVEMRDAKHGRSEGYRDLRDVLKRADMDGEGRGQPDDSGREMVSYGDI